MSVAVIPIQPSYMESYVQNTLLSAALTSTSALSDSDSDAGYGTPAENFQILSPQAKEEQVKVVSGDLDRGGGEITVDSELQEKIIKQVEWYFSDENLLKDSFLMKHINRNKQGYVSLKLVASLRKVKTLTKDWKVVLECLKHSTALSLNEEGTKICRKSPAPQVDFSHITKTLLITEYPQDEPNQADIEQQFGRYGEVTQVRIINPGRAIPLDIKPSKGHFPCLGKDLCILVEFASKQVAVSAYQKIREQQSWRDDMKVQLLDEKKSSQEVKEQKKTTKGKETKIAESHSQKGRHQSNPHSLRDVTPIRQVFHRKITQANAFPSPDSYRRWKLQGVKCSPEPSRKHLRPEAWKDYTSDSGLSCGSRSCSESPRITPEPSRKHSGTEVFRRFGDKAHSHLTSCIIRQPLGPDGTRGFSRPKNSPVSISVHSC